MRSALRNTALGLLVLFLTGCGAVKVAGIFQSSNTSSISGLISIVQLTVVVDNGTDIQVTAVTFLQNGTSNTINFCGNFVDQFPFDSPATVNFMPGAPCATVVQIVIR